MRFLLLIFFTNLLVSCGEKETNHDDSENYNHGRPLVITYEEPVLITRQRQMTLRYDCHGTISSHQLETINGLTKTITIQYENRKHAWSYHVYNRTTKSHGGTTFKSKGKFVVDLAPTMLNMKVDKGINDIEFTFNKCTEIAISTEGKKTCTGEVVVEKEGILRLNVSYQSETLPGERKIYKTPSECVPKHNP